MRLKDFYARAQRANSEEVTFGSSWRSRGDGPWKVVWLQGTGELAAFYEAVGQAGWSTGGGTGGGNLVADIVTDFAFAR